MRIALLLLHAYTATVAAARTPNAYLALKVNSGKMMRQQSELRSNIEYLINDKYYNKLNIGMVFVPADKMDVRLISFHYDDSEHRAMIPSIMANATEVLCSSFPRYLAFDRYFKDGTFLKGGIQDLDHSRFRELARVLNDHGIVYEKNSGIANEKAGFVAAFDFELPISPGNPKAPEFLSELLDMELYSSAYVDTIFFCHTSRAFCDNGDWITIQKMRCN